MRIKIALVNILCFLLISCSYNPFISGNNTTGKPAGVILGAGIGAGAVGLLGGSRTAMLLAGIGGGAVGYYMTTLRYDSGGIIQNGGQVYFLGDVLGIYIPTDNLFESNTATLLPQSSVILDSVVTVLNRQPNNSVIISGDTSGFYHARWEQRLSELRAQRVAAYLWNAGITNNDNQNSMRRLTYVGYGDYFPIAARFTNDGLRSNSRIQIISYPARYRLPTKPLSMREFSSVNERRVLRFAPGACGNKPC